MRTVLLYGSRGYIGGYLRRILEESKMQVICSDSRLENIRDVKQDLDTHHPEYVVSCTGRTHGVDRRTGEIIGTIDYLEDPQTLGQNIQDNLFGPTQLALLCDAREIHYTYVGTGCIYHSNYDDPDHPTVFDETDPPNFAGSAYSTVKGYTDQLLAQISNALVLRIRLPITSENHPRNTVTKLASYREVHSLPNSVTCFSMWNYLPQMLYQREVGVYNFVNKGAITNDEILRLYKQYVEADHEWQLVDQLNLPASRSNTVLSTEKLEQLFPTLPTAQEAVEDCMRAWH